MPGAHRKPSAADSATAGSAAPPVVQWGDGLGQLVHTDVTFLAVAGSQLRTLSCAQCGLVVGRQQFSVYVLISPYPCSTTGNHLPAVAVAFHPACVPGDDAEIASIITWVAQHCASS